MIFHSIVPLEIVFEANSSKEQSDYMELVYKGEKIVASSMGGNRYKIARLISTSPKAYLDPGLQPGTIISI